MRNGRSLIMRSLIFIKLMPMRKWKASLCEKFKIITGKIKNPIREKERKK